MLNNPYLDTIISLVLVYALLSTLVSTLLEAWNKRIKERGVFLQKVIFRLLDDPLNRNYGYGIYQHPIINKMRKDGNSYPHYIPAEGFTNALIDTLADQAVTVRYEESPDGTYVARPYGTELTLADRLVAGIGVMKNSEFKRLLLNFIDRNKVTPEPTGGIVAAPYLDLNKLKDELGRWYDDYMDRTTGEYKDRQRPKLLFIGMLVAVLLNVDSLHLTRVFLLDKGLRDRMVERAEGVSDAVLARKDTSEEGLRVAVMKKLMEMDTTQFKHTHSDTILMKSLAVVLDDSTVVKERNHTDSLLYVLDQWQLPIGWSWSEAPLSWNFKTWGKNAPLPPVKDPLLSYFTARNRGSGMDAFLWLIGVLVTGWSLSMGAPFWFETLVKLVNIRRSGVKPKTTEQLDS